MNSGDLEIVAGMEQWVSALGLEENTAELRDSGCCNLRIVSFCAESQLLVAIRILDSPQRYCSVSLHTACVRENYNMAPSRKQAG